MAYSADTFVADEQPTTAKWNKLWSNDASFNDGTGIAAGAISSTHLVQNFFRGRAQANTTDSSPTGLTVQFGWGFIVGDATAKIEETVTFPTAFSSVPIYIGATVLGARATASGTPDTLDDFDTEYGETVSIFASDVSATSFLVNMNKITGNTFANTFNSGYSWMAIGTV